jgi:Flp pilus assembly protein TadG
VRERSSFPSEVGAQRAKRLRFFRLRRNEDGSVAIEFAIIAPVFFFLMFVIAETALVFIAEQVLENAVFETARLIRTGQAQNANMSEADFKAEVCGRASIFIDCDGADFYLDVRSFDKFQDVQFEPPVDEDDNFTEPQFDYGQQSDIVVVRTYYQWPINPVMGRQWLNLMGNGKLLIGSFSVFRNEPFTSTASN